MIYRFPLKMHIGEKSLAIIEIGSEVKRGQCIAIPEKLGVKIHSSINGKVIEIKNDCVYIEAYGIQSKEYIKIKDCNTISEYAYEAGIIGAGGAGFPTNVKLNTEIVNGIVIANCVECEPLLNHNIKRIEDSPILLIKGIMYAMESTKAVKAIIGIKAKNFQAINILEKIIKELKYNIEIHKVENIYPMGEERALIHSIFNEWLLPTELPTKINSIVLNAETLINITRAIEERKPVIDKDFTVVGDFKDRDKSRVYLDCPVGYPIKELIKNDQLSYEIGEVVIGGPYTGKSEKLEEAFITKCSGGAIFTIPFPTYRGPVGLLVCACGGDAKRLEEIASKMGSEIKATVFCKNIAENGKCMTPGTCPGQVQKIMYLKSQGAKRIIMSNCNDCSNTVMSCAPKLGLGVYHATDHIFRTVGYPLSRRMKID